VKQKAPNQLLLLKSETGSNFISSGVLAGPKLYCVETDKGDIKQVSKGSPTHYVKDNFNMNVLGNCMKNSLVTRMKIMVIRSLK
jgi:hypothetical protein